MAPIWLEFSVKFRERFGEEDVFLHPGWTEPDMGSLFAELAHVESGLHLGGLHVTRDGEQCLEVSFESYLSALNSFASFGIADGFERLEDELVRGIPVIESRRDWTPDFPGV